MARLENQRKRTATIVSSVCSDGTLVETTFDKVKQNTAFLIARGASIEQGAEWAHDGANFRPIRAANNLIKHNSVLLPSEASPFTSIEDLLAEIDRYIAKYVSLSNEARHLATGYALLSWVYDAFPEMPYLRFRGDYGTGKTRALLTVGAITYKPFFASGASTVSPIFHTLDTFRGTLIFDEADFRFSDEKAELVKILNNGNARGFPVLRTRMTEKREFDPQAFVVYGPKIVGMRNSYEDRALESRFLSIDMPAGKATGVPINLPADQETEALVLRNKLLMYRFRHRNSVALDATLADFTLEARTNQILLPLLSVVPEGEVRSSIRRIAGARETELASERGLSPEGRVIEILGRQKSFDRLPLKDIVSSFAEAYGSDYQRPVTSRYIGSLLRRLGLGLYKSDGVYVLSPGQQDEIAALCTRYGVSGGDKPGTSVRSGM